MKWDRVLLIVAAWGIASAAGTADGSTMAADVVTDVVAYDSIPGAGTGGYGSGVTFEIGQIVTLEGELRPLTSLEVRVRLFGDGLPSPSWVRLRLYDASGPGVFPGPPGPLLWEGLADSSVYDPLGGGCCGAAVVGAQLPRVAAARAVAWTIQQIEEPADFLVSAVSSDSPQAGLPTVGESGRMIARDTGSWISITDPSTLTARIRMAVPEPDMVRLLAPVVALIALRLRAHAFAA